jgi:rhodanese-related sulfurtransferase
MSTDRPANTIADLLEAARARLERIEPAAARDAVASGAVIVDTRCAEARQVNGVIPGSVHVPPSVLYWRLDPTSGHDDPSLSDSTRQVILACADGYSSSLAAATLRDLGFARATDVGRRLQRVGPIGPPGRAAPGRSGAGRPVAREQ